MTKQAIMNQRIRIERRPSPTSQDNAVTVPDNLSVRYVVHNRRWRHLDFVDSACLPADEMRSVNR
ncbi:MAG: hypothetical protein OER96_08615 [Gammaproteobacteria bacterium]|nr:hypothetical protein [Gammaproteobacteria bacterium]